MAVAVAVTDEPGGMAGRSWHILELACKGIYWCILACYIKDGIGESVVCMHIRSILTSNYTQMCTRSFIAPAYRCDCNVTTYKLWCHCGTRTCICTITNRALQNWWWKHAGRVLKKFSFYCTDDWLAATGNITSSEGETIDITWTH